MQKYIFELVILSSIFQNFGFLMSTEFFIITNKI